MFRLPRGSLVGQARRRTDLASYFHIGQALSEKVRSDMLKASAIVRQFPEVVAKHLFIQIPEQMKRFDAHVGALNAALENAPEIFEAVGMNAALHISASMVNDAVLVMMLQALIGHERIGINGASGLDILLDLLLQRTLAAIGNHDGANL